MKAYTAITQDGEQLIEWIGENERFALWFDANGESSWNYVNKSGTMEAGSIDEKTIIAIRNGLKLINGK